MATSGSPRTKRKNMNPKPTNLTPAELIQELRAMQRQIIHGTNIFGEIADLIDLQQDELTKLQRAAGDWQYVLQLSRDRDEAEAAKTAAQCEAQELREINHGWMWPKNPQDKCLKCGFPRIQHTQTSGYRCPGTTGDYSKNNFTPVP